MIPLGILASARPPAIGGENPPVAGAIAWWDFADEGQVAVSLGFVSDVWDKSGNTNDLIATWGGGPVYDPSVDFNNRYVAKFQAGQSQGLETLQWIGITDDSTIFVVASKATNSMQSSNIDSLVSIGTGVRTFVTLSTLTIDIGASNWAVSTVATEWQPAQVHTRIVSGSTHSYWLNGVLYVDAVTGDAGYDDTVYVGFLTTSDSDWHIGEVLIYPTALSGTDRVAVEDWLNAKWGF